MAVEDWLGDWLARRPPPPPDLLFLGLEYARELLAAEGAMDGEEEGAGAGEARGGRGERRGTALERLLAHRPLSSLLLGPDALATYGGAPSFLAAARALAAFTHTHGGLRRRLLGAPLGLWARLGREEDRAAVEAASASWTPGPSPRGLRNQGNTCYLNSLLQQLASLEACREGVLLEEGEGGVVGAMTGEDAARWEEDAAGVQLLGELVSERCFCLPVALCVCFFSFGFNAGSGCADLRFSFFCLAQQRVLAALGDTDGAGRRGSGVETRRLVEVRGV